MTPAAIIGNTILKAWPMVMVNRYILIIILLIISSSIRGGAQMGGNNSIYLETMGAGGWGSLNYERNIGYVGSFRFDARTGAGFYRMRDFYQTFNPDFTIPSGFHVTYNYQNHAAELALGNVISSIVYFEEGQRKRRWSSDGYLGLGYRYTHKTGVFARVLYYPLWEKDHSFFRHWAGLSLGFSFGK